MKTLVVKWQQSGCWDSLSKLTHWLGPLWSSKQPPQLKLSCQDWDMPDGCDKVETLV